MKLLEEDLRIGGRELKRYVFCPDDAGQIRACAMHFHGQGDYSSRYDEIMRLFTDQGLACVATDLPGHGASEGRRGRVPGFEIVDQITHSNEERCRELCPDGPLGLLGHSAGGLMGLRALLKRRDAYSFSWISSPLILPEANQNRLLLRILSVVGKLVPGMTVGTGVTSDQCSHEESQAERHPEGEDLFHARVSLGWGRELIDEACLLREQLVANPPTLPILITQGGEDPICPPQHLRKVLDCIASANIRYMEFPEALHEPFADTGKEEVFAKILGWLGEVLDPAQTSPCG